MEFEAQRYPDPPGVLPRGLIVLLTIAAIVIAMGGLRSIADIVGPTFLALMLAIAADPLRSWLVSKRWPGWAAVVGTLVVVYSLLLALVAALVISAAQLATLLPTYADRFTELTDGAQATLADLGIGDEQFESAASSVDPGRLVGLLESLLSGLAGVLSSLFFLVTILLFMCMDSMHLPDRLRTASGERPQVVAALSTFAAGTKRYLVVSTVFGLIVAVIDTIALQLLDIPLPLLWGLLAFLTNYIPNIGFVIGVIPPALLGLLEGGPELMLAVIVVYSLVNVVIQSGIQPKFVGDAVGLSVTLTFLSMVIWTWILGPLGALLALPLSLLTKALLLDIDPNTRWMSALIASGGQVIDPAPPASAIEPGPVPVPTAAESEDQAP